MITPRLGLLQLGLSRDWPTLCLELNSLGLEVFSFPLKFLRVLHQPAERLTQKTVAVVKPCLTSAMSEPASLGK